MRPLKPFSAFAAALGLLLTFTIAHAAQHEGKMRKGNIVQTAEDAGEFTILVKALKETGLDEELQSRGPYTLFAPTDAAFKKLGQKKLNDLMKPENKAQLSNILKYHVVQGKATRREMAGKKTDVTTIDQRMLSVDGTRGIVIDQRAKVIQPDMEATNGIIYPVNEVLIP